MKFNQWTLGLAALGIISAASVAHADEKASSVSTALANTTLSGYVDTSAQWNPGDGNSHAPNYEFGGPSKADGFNLNSIKLSLSKSADNADAWAAGYQVDLMFGPDAGTYGTSYNSGGDFAVRQAYVDLKAPIGTGLDIKIGVWDGILGYESTDSVNNPNFTRSWAKSIEPTTHTGVLLGYNVTDDISVQAGVANTYGAVINQKAQQTTLYNGNGYDVTPSETEKTYLASVAWTASTNLGWFSGSTLYAGLVNGFSSSAPSAGSAPSDEISWYLGATINTPLKDLKLGASYDYTDNQKHDTYHTGYAWAVDTYALYQVSEKFSLNGRAEYAQLNPFYDNGFTLAAPGIASKVISLTATAQYDLWKNVVSRLEFRWDHAADGNAAFGSDSPTGYTAAGYNGTLKNSYELIANVVYKF